MTSPDPRAPWWMRPLLPLAATRFGGWFMIRVAPVIDRFLLRISRGRLGITAAMPTLILTSLGARSGLPRTTPLIYLPDEERIVLIASNGGHPANPAWYYNMRKHPRVMVLINAQEIVCLAQEASGPERERLWGRAVQMYPGYAVYQRRSSQRTIPVMVLTRLDQ
jgi:deazaflavin-dependent oxidoreductase (nitroreductase family)